MMNFTFVVFPTLPSCDNDGVIFYGLRCRDVKR